MAKKSASSASIIRRGIRRPSRSGSARTSGNLRTRGLYQTSARRTMPLAQDVNGMIAHGGNPLTGPLRCLAPGVGRTKHGRKPGASGQAASFAFILAQVARPSFLATLHLQLCSFARTNRARLLKAKSLGDAAAVASRRQTANLARRQQQRCREVQATS